MVCYLLKHIIKMLTMVSIHTKLWLHEYSHHWLKNHLLVFINSVWLMWHNFIEMILGAQMIDPLSSTKFSLILLNNELLITIFNRTYWFMIYIYSGIVPNSNMMFISNGNIEIAWECDQIFINLPVTILLCSYATMCKLSGKR